MDRISDRNLFARATTGMTPAQAQAWWRGHGDHNFTVGVKLGKRACNDPEVQYVNGGKRTAVHVDNPSGSDHRRVHRPDPEWYVQGSLPGHVGEWEI